jgi:hypothetical protein
VPKRGASNDLEQRAVVLAAVILAPRHLARIGVQVDADPVMLTDLGAAEAREVALREVGAGILIAEGDTVVDPFGIVEGM